MTPLDAKTAFETLRIRVLEVAALKRACALAHGAGRLLWIVGFPLLVLTALEIFVGLPFWLRAPILPAAGLAALFFAWAGLVRPMRERHTAIGAALLVEAQRPDLLSRLVSALQLYPELEQERPRFDATMVRALVIQTQTATAGEDFRAVIDRRPARNQALLGALALLAWGLFSAVNPAGVSEAFRSFAHAWEDVRNAMLKAAGAKIVIEPLEREAYLTGSTVWVRARQEGFLRGTMTAHLRTEGSETWSTESIAVDDSGRGHFEARDLRESFEIYFSAGAIESEIVRVPVTDRPRIVNLEVVYEYPAYVRRAPAREARSDGNLSALFGTSLVLTVEANVELKAVRLIPSYGGEPVVFSVGGRFAKTVIRLERPEWLADPAPEIQASYTLEMADRFGFTNTESDRRYGLRIQKDAAPRLGFSGVPNRSPEHEPHITDSKLGGVTLAVKGSDDFGLAKVTLHYRLESLDTGALKREDSVVRVFSPPVPDLPHLGLVRLSDLGAQVGDRVVFWAEAEDAYDLEPGQGPHRVKTPAYRIAVVTEEELFREVVNRDEWTPNLYDSVKRASLLKREVPPRLSPELEPAAKVAEKLLSIPQSNARMGRADELLVEGYFESLNASE